MSRGGGGLQTTLSEPRYSNAGDIPMIADGPLSPYSALFTKLLV